MDNSFLIKLGMNVEDVANGLTQANSMHSGFKDQVGEVSKSIASAFAVERIAHSETDCPGSKRTPGRSWPIQGQRK